jgi:hypothetical protein
MFRAAQRIFVSPAGASDVLNAAHRSIPCFVFTS